MDPKQAAGRLNTERTQIEELYRFVSPLKDEEAKKIDMFVPQERSEGKY